MALRGSKTELNNENKENVTLNVTLTVNVTLPKHNNNGNEETDRRPLTNIMNNQNSRKKRVTAIASTADTIGEAGATEIGIRTVITMMIVDREIRTETATILQDAIEIGATAVPREATTSTAKTGGEMAIHRTMSPNLTRSRSQRKMPSQVRNPRQEVVTKGKLSFIGRLPLFKKKIEEPKLPEKDIAPLHYQQSKFEDTPKVPNEIINPLGVHITKLATSINLNNSNIMTLLASKIIHQPMKILVAPPPPVLNESKPTQQVVNMKIGDQSEETVIEVQLIMEQQKQQQQLTSNVSKLPLPPPSPLNRPSPSFTPSQQQQPAVQNRPPPVQSTLPRCTLCQIDRLRRSYRIHRHSFRHHRDSHLVQLCHLHNATATEHELRAESSESTADTDSRLEHRSAIAFRSGRNTVTIGEAFGRPEHSIAG